MRKRPTLEGPDLVSRLPADTSGERRDAESLVRLLAIMLYAYPIIWLIGLGGFFVIVTAVPSVLYMVRARLSMPSRLAALVAVALIMCVPVGVIYFGFDLSRVISVAGNVAVWITLAAGLDAASKVDARYTLARALNLVAIVQGALTLAAVVALPSRIPLPLLEGVSHLLPSGPASFAESRLIYDGWLGGFTLRSAGIMSNPTWAGAFASLALLVAIYFVVYERRSVAYFAIGALFAAVSLNYSLSRSAWVLVALAAGAGLLFLLRRRSRPAFTALVAIIAPLVLAFLLVGTDDIVRSLNDANEERVGSAVSRGDIYATTAAYIGELGLPILGYGIKPKEEGLVASVGTHSTYLGIVFRAGLVGLGLLVALVVVLLSRVVARSDALGMAILVFLAGWMALGDLDAGHLAPFFLLLVLGYPESRSVSKDLEEGRAG